MSRKCKEGFVKTYVEYAQNQESPSLFHKWVALSVIASVVRRRVWLSSGANEEGYYNIFPNLYLVLVSPSGVGRKSTALEMGLSLIEKAGIEPFHVIKGKITPARVMDRLNLAMSTDKEGRAEILIFSSEFKVFTRGIMSDSSLIEDLTHLYDGKSHNWETKHEGVYVVEKPCVNLMAASTPEWLTGKGELGDLMSGGFGSRLTPVAISKHDRKIGWAKKNYEALEKEEWLVEDLKEISKLEGRFFVTAEAERVFNEWYEKAEEYRISDTRLDGYYSKKHDQVRKVAMLLSISQGDELVVDERHILVALKMFQEIEKTMTLAYVGVAWGETGRFNDRVLTKIKDAGESGISYSDLMRTFHFAMDKEQLKKVLGTLMDEELVRAEIVKTKTKTRVMYYYVEKEETATPPKEETPTLIREELRYEDWVRRGEK